MKMFSVYYRKSEKPLQKCTFFFDASPQTCYAEITKRIAKNNPDLRQFYSNYYPKKKEDFLVYKFNIAVMPGDGIGKEITAPSFELISQAAKTVGIELNPIEVEAGAELYVRTGVAFPEENFQEAAKADAIYLAAMGLPTVRYPDGTEVGPQHDLRKRLKLYAGVRPCITMPGLPLPLKDPRAEKLDFVIVRESTEGIFASPLATEKDSEEAAYNLIKITRETSEKLFNYSFKLAESRKKAGKMGKVTCIDKANVLSSMFFFRRIFDEVAQKYPDVAKEYCYVDFAAMRMVKRPWDFDVCPTENQFGDILSDLASGLMGGMGMAPSADVGDNNAVFQPCHGTAPKLVGTGKANPTAMILSGGMMLDYLGTKFNCPEASKLNETITQAVRNTYAPGKLLPHELGDTASMNDIFAAVSAELEKLL